MRFEETMMFADCAAWMNLKRLLGTLRLCSMQVCFLYHKTTLSNREVELVFNLLKMN